MDEDNDTSALVGGVLAGALAFAGGAWFFSRRPGVVTGGVHFGAALALAKHWGGLFGVAPIDIMAIMGIESSYNPNETNQNERAAPLGGAWGLMQILPGTAADLVVLLRRNYPSSNEISNALSVYNAADPQSLLDPNLNSLLGIYYMKRLQDEFHDFDKVATAYQQGPGRVRSGKVGPLGEQYAEAALLRRARLAEEGVVV